MKRQIMHKLSSLLLVAGALVSSKGLAQNVNIGDPGFPQSSPAPCNTFGTSGNNFFDNGGSGGNYTPNFSGTTVLCPDLNLGTKMQVAFGINAGFAFDVHGSDSIYVYDGPNTSSPLMGVHNSVTDPNGFTHVATWNNPTGCLTIKFVTDGANEGAGWVANAQCGNQPQPFTPHIEAFVNGSGPNRLNPIDTGFVDVCFGDSILFVTKPNFPYALEVTGNGYSQNLTTVNYTWYISDGGTYPNNDSIWFKPPARSGYLVDLKITDLFPQTERLLAKVRVSQKPDFTGTGPVEDTVCLGQNTILLGGVTATDTVGISIPPGTFELGGSFAGLTYLPDGSGQNYTAPITISGFPTGAVINNAQSLNMVSITMEHSYAGDLEIWLTCPTGQQVNLVNSYNPGALPGGTSGSSRFLGHPFDDTGGGGPGIGWEYKFSSVFNTIDPMINNWFNSNANIIVTASPGPPQVSAGTSMSPNFVYEPENSFANFTGCPVNGVWTINVRDNLSIDDGYIFEWGLFFDPSYFPGLSGYHNTADSVYWSANPTIVSQGNDTLTTILPNQPGTTFYTYNMIDNFGCHYDTVVTLFTHPQPTIFNDTWTCNYTYNVTGTTAVNGGVWSCADTNVHFIPNVNVMNPTIVSSIPGTFTVTFTDNQCGTAISSTIDFVKDPYVYINDTVLCQGSTGVLTCVTFPQNDVYSWNDGTSGPTIQALAGTNYMVTASNECGTSSDSLRVASKVCDVNAPNIIVLSSQNGNNKFYLEYDGVKEFQITIVNRWGNKITEYSDPADAWDGKNMNGEVVSEGIYFYRLDATFDNNEKVTKQGFIQVYH
jgi:subtilisin-like proprotein convertase family protein